MKYILPVMFLIVGSITMQAQVTIGMNGSPAKAALLELKNYSSAADLTTSDKGGLVLPRVKLSNRTTLQPFIGTGDTEWNDTNKDKTQKDHIGTTVYNLTNNADFSPGLYMWTASGWKPMEIASDYICLPSFRVRWVASGSVDLFNDVYKANFNPASLSNYTSSKGGLVSLPEYTPKADDFYYVVTNYDKTAINVTGISPTGVLSYSIATAAKDDPTPPENAYVNVVMIKK